MAKNRREEKKRKLASAKKAAANSGNMFERPSLNVPNGCTVHGWSEAGTFRYNFIGYVLKANHNNPEAKAQGLGEGDVFFRRRYWVHRQPGEGNDALPCLKRNFGKACPGCEAQSAAAREFGGDSDEAKGHRPKLRELYNHEDVDDKDKGLQVFEYSQFGFGEMLDTKINAADDDDEVEFFYDAGEQGKTVKIVVDKHPKMNNFFPAKDVSFKDRREHPGEEMLEKAWNLDDMVKEISYAEFKKRYEAPPEDVPADDDAEETPPARGKKSETKPAAGKKPAAKPDPDDDDDLDSDIEPATQKDDDAGEPVDFQIDDFVEFEYKGKTYKGVISLLNERKEFAEVEVEGRTKPMVVDFADMKLVGQDDDAGDDDDDQPPARTTGKKPPVKPTGKKPETTREDLDDDDDDPDDSDMEPLDLDSDLEPEEDEPRKKPTASKPAPARRR